MQVSSSRRYVTVANRRDTTIAWSPSLYPKTCKATRLRERPVCHVALMGRAAFLSEMENICA
jgi:hypothetical protein